MKYREIIRKVGSYGTTVLAGMSLESYIRGLRKDLFVDPLVKDVLETNKNQNRIIQELLETKIENAVDKSNIEAKAENVRSSMDIIHNKSEQVQLINEQLKSTSLSETEKLVLQSKVDNATNSISTEAAKVNDALGSIIDIIKGKASGSGTSSSFTIETIQDYYYRIYAGIDQLSLEQKGALVNLFSTLTVLICVTTLIGMFAGDRLIEYLKIEQRFPRLERYFTLRRKFR